MILRGIQYYFLKKLISMVINRNLSQDFYKICCNKKHWLLLKAFLYLCDDLHYILIIVSLNKKTASIQKQLWFAWLSLLAANILATL